MELYLPKIPDSIFDKRELAMCRRLLAKYKQSLGIKPQISLETRIQALPQELQDVILDFKLLSFLPCPRELRWDPKNDEYTVLDLPYVSIPPSLAHDFNPPKYRILDAKGDASWQEGPIPFDEVVPVDLSYIPPVALQINRRSRAAMAKIFYGNTVLFVQSMFYSEDIQCGDGVWMACLHDRGCWLQPTHQRDFILSLSEEHRGC